MQDFIKVIWGIYAMFQAVMVILMRHALGVLRYSRVSNHGS